MGEAIEHQFGYSLEMASRVWEFYRQEIIPTGCHKLFGPPTTFELDITEEARILAKGDKSFESDTAADWLLLLELELADLPMDEDGRLYFMIRRDDLAACRFNKTYLLHDAIQR